MYMHCYVICVFFLIITNFFRVEELQHVCSKYLRDCINFDNVFILFSQSKMYNNAELERKCLEFIEVNCAELLKIARKSILELSYEDLLTIVKSDHLEVSEMEVFGSLTTKTTNNFKYSLFITFFCYFITETCMAWAANQCEKKQLESNVENKRKLLKEIFYNIRFTCMDKEQFSLQVVPTQILTMEESLMIFTFWCTTGKVEISKFNKVARETRKVGLVYLLL